MFQVGKGDDEEGDSVEVNLTVLLAKC